MQIKWFLCTHPPFQRRPEAFNIVRMITSFRHKLISMIDVSCLRISALIATEKYTRHSSVTKVEPGFIQSVNTCVLVFAFLLSTITKNIIFSCAGHTPPTSHICPVSHQLRIWDET